MINLYTISLFVHVVSIATLFGGISLMAMVLRDATRSNDVETMSKAMEKVQRWNLTMFIPTAVLVLITGVYMLMQYSNKPLWLLVKERFGSLVIILFIVLVAWYGKKLLQRVKASGNDLQKATGLVKRYIMLLNLFLLFMIVLIFFVTTKLT
jgi:uncharacterized membrane protein